MSDEPGVWEVRLGMYATRQQAEEVKEGITRLLCPDPDHAPPCPVPWTVSLIDMTNPEDDGDGDGDAYPELVEQARIENRLPRK